MILIGRLGAAEPILGNLWELDAIAAAAIGGASLMGGKGSVVGTILGAIILGAHAQRADADERPGLLSIAGHWSYHPRRDADRSRRQGDEDELEQIDPKAVGPRIRMMMPHLTPLEARVVETMFGPAELRRGPPR